MLTSRQHPLAKLARSLHAARSRREHGLFLIEGSNGVGAALSNGHALQHVLATPEAAPAWSERAAACGAEIHVLAPELLAYACESASSPSVAAIAPLLRPAPSLPDDGLILILDGIGDPGNTGTLLRAADGMGASQFAATSGSADVFAPKTVRASAGSLWSVPPSPLHQMEPSRAVQVLEEARVPIVTAEAHGGVDYGAIEWPSRCALVIGHETRGVSPEFSQAASQKATIPIWGRAESLNAAMAGTLLLYAWRRGQRSEAG